MLQRPLAVDGSARAVQEPSLDPPANDLEPRLDEQLLRLRGDLRLGLPVILRDGAGAVLVASLETLSADRHDAMRALGGAELALTRRRAEALGLRPPGDGAALRLRVPAGGDATWLAAISGQDGEGRVATIAEALSAPAAATPAQCAAIALARSAQLLPAVLTVALGAGAAPSGLASMSVAAVTEALDVVHAPARVSTARLPMAAADAGRVHLFRPVGGEAEHYAVEIGEPDPTRPVLVRLHSACFTGDVLGSLKCDCGAQLRAAMATMAEAGGGMLLYLDQEGRGIGLANKLRAYARQDAGLDTVEANHWLGFEDDQRDFGVGALLLRRLGIDRVRLMTNNPLKVESLASHGIEVTERVPLDAGRTAHNAAYLATKAAKSGHLL